MTFHTTTAAPIDFATLYDEHADYAARRLDGSHEHAQILLETTQFKIPFLAGLLPPGHTIGSVLEIGCATGELVAHFPVAPNGRRTGCDISPANIATAAKRYPTIRFLAGDFRTDFTGEYFDCIILSDVLEHVDDDVDFLRDAAQIGRHVLINLPIEDNWLNRKRAYGPKDVSGHLRRYSVADGLALCRRAGLTVSAYRHIWAHEQRFDRQRRALRRVHAGQEFSGPLPTRLIKAAVTAGAHSIRPFGRWLFASNLFVIAAKASP